MKDINYALVEEKRPPIYTAMKYWGKKPHNIWRKYIETYSEEGGIILDPFSGSAMSALETVKAKRKAIAFDLNPLTSFLVEVFCSKFQEKEFLKKVNNIITNIELNPIYTYHFLTNCRRCSNTSAIIQNIKWDANSIYEIGIICPDCGNKYVAQPNEMEIKKSLLLKEIALVKWFPTEQFSRSPSFTKNFTDHLGGNTYADLWTRRNLFVLSEIFDQINFEKDESIKKQLLFGFLQTLHLCTKMCVPRRENAKRSFSTSWGRSAYLCSARQMEMNPLLVFKSSCIGKQSVQSSLVGIEKYIGKIPSINYVDIKKDDPIDIRFDINYGIVDIKKICQIVKDESIDFIITDPPYGGLVQYLDLSNIWLVWLKRIDTRYVPSYDDEITIKKGIKDLHDYSTSFTDGIKSLYRILKPDGKIVFTFHNKDIKIWNAFLHSIFQAGFKIEKVIHQQNRRTGESNVANPYGTSASDFYIRCGKSEYVKQIKTTRDEFENYIVTQAINIIKARNEPTPYQILFNGLLAEISKAGFEIDDFDSTIKRVLSKHLDDIFEITDNTKNKAGNFWWIKEYKASTDPIEPLSQRLEKTIYDLFSKNRTLSLDEVIGEVFLKYQNGLTPDIKTIDYYVKKYALRAGEKWKAKGA